MAPVTVEIQIAAIDGAAFAGVARDGMLTDLWGERLDRAGLIGSVYAAKVLRADRTAGAAFLDIGAERPAYLPLRPGRAVPVEGGLALVQIVGEPREDKGAEATLDVALAGRWLVHVPESGEVTVSRELGPGARQQWRRLLSGGWIVRRAAAEAALPAVEAEACRLSDRWASIQARFGAARGPELLERGPGVARRALLDNPGASLVRLDSAATDPALAPWIRHEFGDAAPRLETGPTDIPDLLPALLDPVVALPSGGSIVIEPTRALTVIDVNAGAARDPFHANREAAAEIARQLRLRNVGGIVVIDFISMKRRDEGLVVAALRRAVEGDPARLRLADRLSSLGLFELARERRGPALFELAAP